MDTSRLLEVLDDIESEFEAGYLKEVQQLIQQYTVARDGPSLDRSEEIREALDSLSKFLSDSVVKDYPPSKYHILSSIGYATYFGSQGLENLKKILGEGNLTTAGVVSSLTEFLTKLNELRKSCASTRNGLIALGIKPHSLSEGESEVGILIPTALTDSRLIGLKGQLDSWNQIVRGFAEVAGEEDREITVSALSSGSNEVYLAVGYLTAVLLAKAIDKVLSWYKQVLEIRIHRLVLEKLKALPSDIVATKQYEKSLLDLSINELAKELITSSTSKILEGRKHELENQLVISIRRIAKFVDNGGDVEVSTHVPEAPEEPEEPEEADKNPEKRKEYLRQKKEYEKLLTPYNKAIDLSRKGSALRSLPRSDQPILQIEDIKSPKIPRGGKTKIKKKPQDKQTI